MELYEAINNRRNVHKFKDEEIPKDTLEKILETGLLASSARNTQPWEFIVVTDKEQVKNLAQYKYDHNMQGLLASNFSQEEAEELASTQRDAFNNCTPVIVIFDTGHAIASESSWNSITTIWLAATAEGIGISPAYFAPHAQGPIMEMFNIPEKYVIAAILRMGIPEVIPDAKPRKRLDACCYLNKFGETS